MSAARRLRVMLERPEGTLAMGIYDCLSARIAEHAGIELGAISGNGLTAALLGYPDVGLSTLTEIVGQARHIADSVNIPLIADADDGYGNALNVTRTVNEFEAAGIAGIQLEDQAAPKRSSTVGSAKLLSDEDFVLKIRAACAARRDRDFVIIARTDARLAEGLGRSIDRMRKYLDAGADAAFYSSLQSADEMQAVIDATPKPIKLNVIEGYPAAQLSVDQLFAMGFKIVGYSGILQRASLKAMADAVEVFQRERSTEGTLREMCMEPADRNELLGVSMYKNLEADLMAGSGTP